MALRTSTLVPRKRRPLNRGGFSLIEVVLAISLVSVAFLTLTGLLGSAMTSFHDGMSTAVSSQIAQELINSEQQTDFNQLASQTFYFDVQGNPLPTSQSAQAVYQASTTVATSTTLPGSVANSYLATITVQVARVPGSITVNWSNPAPGLPIKTYTTKVAKD